MPPTPPDREETPSDAVATLTDLSVWGVPLVAVHRTRAAQLVSVGPVLERDELATAASRAVVGPNNDTLYSSHWYDLRAGDVTIDVPRFEDPDRYWSVMLLDAYTHVRYVSRRTHGRDGASVRIVLDPSASTAAVDPDIIGIATPTVWVLVRVLVAGPDDLDAARRAQRSVHVVHDAAAAADAGLGSGPGDAPPPGRASTPRERFAELAAAVAIDPPVRSQPPPPPGSIALLSRLLADPSATPVLDAADAAARSRLEAAGSGADTFADGWGTRRRGADFGDDATYRAAFARVSLAGHLPVENRGYNARVDGRMPTTLRFPPGGEPPVSGFWSLTLYGPDLFFVANDLDRYSIGDRTAGLVRDADGGLTITIAQEPPPEGPSNWLPAPAGPAFVVLRCYEGAPEVVDATWFPPPLTSLGAPG